MLSLVLGYVVPLSVEHYYNKLKEDCIEKYTQFTFLELQNVRIPDYDRMAFAIYWFDTCSDLDYNITFPEFKEKVERYLTQHNDTNVGKN